MHTARAVGPKPHRRPARTRAAPGVTICCPPSTTGPVAYAGPISPLNRPLTGPRTPRQVRCRAGTFNPTGRIRNPRPNRERTRERKVRIHRSPEEETRQPSYGAPHRASRVRRGGACIMADAAFPRPTRRRDGPPIIARAVSSWGRLNHGAKVNQSQPSNFAPKRGPKRRWPELLCMRFEYGQRKKGKPRSVASPAGN